MSKSVDVLVVASAQWMNPSSLAKKDELRGCDDAFVPAACNKHAAITYATLSMITETLAAKGMTPVFHASDLHSEVAIRNLWQTQGGQFAPVIETTFSKDTLAGFTRFNTTLANVVPFIVVTFGVERTALVEHAVAKACEAGIHAHASEVALDGSLSRRGWITPENIMSFYPTFENSNRWTAWERIQRMGAQQVMAIDIDAIKAAAAEFAAHHFDGHEDRCNKCAAPKHKGRCTKAALAAVDALQ